MKIETMRRLLNYDRAVRHVKQRGGISMGYARTRDAAFTFRMGAGFAGECNRSHPFTIEPAQNDPTSPVLAYGLACMQNSGNSVNDIRSVATGDSAATSIFGILVRPYPITPQSGTNFGALGFGATVAPSTLLTCEVLKSGYIVVAVSGFVAGSTVFYKGSAVEVWYAASSGAHVQGGFEFGHTGGSSFPLDASGNRIYWNGPPDANGVAELVFNP